MKSIKSYNLEDKITFGKYKFTPLWKIMLMDYAYVIWLLKEKLICYKGEAKKYEWKKKDWVHKTLKASGYKLMSVPVQKAAKEIPFKSTLNYRTKKQLREQLKNFADWEIKALYNQQFERVLVKGNPKTPEDWLVWDEEYQEWI